MFTDLFFRKMLYDQQILKILSRVGERGISVSMLAKHVYNLNSTFFFQPDFQYIRQYVQQYLLHNSKSSQSLIESTGKRGYYRLNTAHSADARQLMLDFKEQQPEADEPTASRLSEDHSLFLFTDEELA